jgi:hypothetical protein
VIAAVRASGEKASVHARTRATNKLNGGGLEQLLAIVGVLAGDFERREPDTRTLQEASTARAGRHDARVRRSTQHRFGHARRRVDHVFAIVQNEQKALGAERGRHPVRRLRAVGQSKLERNRDADRHEAGIGERRELG